MGHKLQGTSARIAQTLLDIRGVIMAPDEPFVWASGHLAPVYCDNRLLLSYPDARTRITKAFLELLDGREIDAVVGVATAGIAYAALVADRLNLPMAYVRGKPKGHGRRRQIEGRLDRGSRVVIIEDLVATGGSSLRVAEVVREAIGVPPLGVWAVITYNLPGVKDKFAATGVPLHTLTTFDVLMQVGLERRFIKASDLDGLQRWQQDVEAWSARHRGQSGGDR